MRSARQKRLGSPSCGSARGNAARPPQADSCRDSGLGLLGALERVSVLSGEFQIATALGRCTVITVTMPVAALLPAPPPVSGAPSGAPMEDSHG
jgi:hypothetical protein